MPLTTQPATATATANMTRAAEARRALAPVDYVPLTAEGLLLFCQSRLRELDDAIQRKMAGQTELVALQSMVGEVSSCLKEQNGGVTTQEQHDRAVGLVDAAIAKAEACGQNMAVESLQSVRRRLTEGDFQSAPDEVKDMSNMLDTALSSCRSSAEVSMIELQSLVSKRATQLQLTTGMMNSIDEAPKAIAANIGR